ncbi:MAG: endonuclease/exonuclease/phosphatase family protein [Acidimicrobiales bacterium]
MPEVVVASCNVHAGVDGWGRALDVVGACRSMDADVLVLQETWRADGSVGLAEEVATSLGYACHEMRLARGRLDPVAVPDERCSDPAGDGSARRWGPPRRDAVTGEAWGPPMRGRLSRRVLVLDRPGSRHSPPGPGRGSWGIAVLSRLPVVSEERIDLGQLRRDPARRGALRLELEAGGRSRLVVVGTHLSHLVQGSLLQLSRLRSALPEPACAAILAGDMNLWGPPVSALLPGWRRAVRGRTWPAWGPHSQIDHILVTPAVATLSHDVLGPIGSDHRPVRALVGIP